MQQTALEDALEHAMFVRDEKQSAQAAARWLDELEAVILSLAEMPNRYKMIDERESFRITLRQVLHHSHRVVFHVNEGTQTVHVLRVYHGSRRALSPEDVPTPDRGQ